MAKSNETALYRYYDSADQLLYVGITDDLSRRFGEHRRKSWWGQSSRITIDRYSTREEALRAETLAIAEEYPIHNVAAPRPNARWLFATCSVCGFGLAEEFEDDSISEPMDQHAKCNESVSDAYQAGIDAAQWVWA